MQDLLDRNAGAAGGAAGAEATFNIELGELKKRSRELWLISSPEFVIKRFRLYFLAFSLKHHGLQTRTGNVNIYIYIFFIRLKY